MLIHGLRKALFLMFCLLMCLTACHTARSPSPVKANERQVAPVWQPLVQRLAQDGIAGDAVDALFEQLPAVHTQSPMGRKIRDLYNKKFFPKPPPKLTDYYKGVVTVANAKRCLRFIREHKEAFERAYAAYGVPPEVAVALLFVETRLGEVLGDVPENAFYTLASMAVSVRPAMINEWIPKLRGADKRLEWIEKTMVSRADWAYREVSALVRYILDNSITQDSLPGSIYGAVGLCQFMPSNIALYGADGDGDGRIDLFTVDDACASLAKYLAKHGWKKESSRAEQHACLMKYNHAKIYANTILALSDLVVREQNRVPAR